MIYGQISTIFPDIQDYATQSALSLVANRINDFSHHIKYDEGTQELVIEDCRISSTSGNVTATGNIYVPDGGTMGVSGGVLWTYDNTNGDISTTAKVGIGIAAAVDFLHIHGGAGTAGIVMTDDTTGATAGDGMAIQQAGLDSYFWNREAGTMYLGTSNANKLSIDSDGVVTMIGTTGALKISVLTTVQKGNLTPANGMIVYDSTLNKFQGYENGAWANLI